MRIGIDLQVLARKPWTGIAKYAWNLARALRELKTNHEFVFFVPENSPSLPLFDQRGRRGEFIVLPSKTIPFWSAHVTYARIMQKAGLDVLHGPANSVPLFYPSRSDPGRSTLPSSAPTVPSGSGEGSKVVITVHDLAIYKNPEWFPRHQWFSTKVLVPRSIKKADAIIVPSQTTANDVAELFKVPEEKIYIVAHGVSESFFVKRRSGPYGQTSDVRRRPILAATPYTNGRKYILFVGTLEPRKNVGRLIQAYQSLPQDIREEYELVIAGNSPSTPSLIKEGEGGVQFLGYVPDENLGALYQNASVFVYPSLYEGFGLPVLEAMAAGVPVITSKDSAMAELVKHNANLRTGYANDAKPPSPHPLPLERGRGGEGVDGSNYALFVNPYSVQEIREAMVRLIRPVRPGSGSPRAGPRWRDTAYTSQISRAGRALARQFTWEKTARRTLEVYLA